MNMRKFYFLSMVAGTVLAYSSCTNDLVEEVSEEISEHVQTGAPMNFSAKVGGKANDSKSQTGKRKVNYADEFFFGSGGVSLKWEKGDLIGVDCPDAYDKDGQATRAVYKVEDPGIAGNTDGLVSYGDTHLYWGANNIHRVFYGYPAGRVIMENLEENSKDPYDFTRSFTASIEHVQEGTVENEYILVNGEPVDGYRAVDKQNMLCGGVIFVERDETGQNDAVELVFDSYFSSVDVIFTNSEEGNLTIKEVAIEMEQDDPDNEISALSGTCSGNMYWGENGLLTLDAITPKEGESYPDVSIKVKGQNGEDTFALPKGKSLSVVLCMLPDKEPTGAQGTLPDDAKFGRTMIGKLKVKYEYAGETEQTKTLDISGIYWINTRNRIDVPTLPHAE